MRILFDQGTPVPIRQFLEGHVVRTAFQQGWDTLNMRIPMMSISRSEVMAISAERSDAGLSQCESVIDIRQESDWFSLLPTPRFSGADGRSP